MPCYATTKHKMPRHAAKWLVSDQGKVENTGKDFIPSAPQEIITNLSLT